MRNRILDRILEGREFLYEIIEGPTAEEAERAFKEGDFAVFLIGDPMAVVIEDDIRALHLEGRTVTEKELSNLAGGLLAIGVYFDQMPEFVLRGSEKEGTLFRGMGKPLSREDTLFSLAFAGFYDENAPGIKGKVLIPAYPVRKDEPAKEALSRTT